MKITVPTSRTRSLWIVVPALLAIAALAAYGLWPRPDPAAVWNRAEDALNSERIDEAEALSRQLTRLRPPLDRDWLLRGQVAIARKRNDEAIADLMRVPDSSPLAPQARLMAGQIELRRNRVRHAETFLRAAVRLDPKLVQAHRELTFLYGMQSRRGPLAEQFRILSELEPLTFQHVYLWCLTRGTVWEPNEIVEFMSRYLKADPDDVWSRLALANALQHLGRLDEAWQALEPLPDSNPDARAARARLAIDRGDMAVAEALLAEGPEDHAELARLRGKLALRRRDAAAALRHFRASDAAEPANRDTIFGIAQALRMAGRNDEAAPYVKLAREHDLITSLMQYAATNEGKKDPALPMKLGAAHEAIGRFQEARAWYQLRIDADPFDPAAQKALHRVRQELDKQAVGRTP